MKEDRTMPQPKHTCEVQVIGEQDRRRLADQIGRAHV